MADGSISQSELDLLFGANGGLEELPEEQHIWLVKSKDNVSLFGGRCYSLWQAQTLQQKVMKEHPGVETIIKQVK